MVASAYSVMLGLLAIPVVLMGVVGTVVYVGYSMFPPSKYAGRLNARAVVPIHLVVLGDIGRSPRMANHAMSIAKHGGQATIIGYLESAPHPGLLDDPNISIIDIPVPPARPALLPFILFAPWKVLHQAFHILVALLSETEAAEWIIVQNPPSVPTILVAAIVCHLRKSRLVIDWHNTGWSILAGKLGSSRHPLVWLSRLYESYFGRRGFFNLTVSEAMTRQLRRPPYNIVSPMMAVHDRPADMFQLISTPEVREAVLRRVLPQLMPRQPAELEKTTLGGLLDRSTRLVVSSTSWTPDEDFGMLLDALVQYAAGATTVGPAPPPAPVLAVITGNGPQRDLYISKAAALKQEGQLQNVTIATAFLPLADYAQLLGCADLGVCLHTSSSGVDLPMKVVDMFGAGTPVVAYSAYESFGELVREGVNGRGFETAEELARILTRLLGPAGQEELAVLRAGAVREGERRWDEEWDSKAGIILGLVGR